MTIGTIAAVVGGTIAAFFGVKMLGKADDRVEDRRRGTLKLAVWAKENGLPILTDLLENYTVGAKTEIIGSVRSLVDVIRDTDQSKAALDTFLKIQLQRRLGNYEGREQVLGMIEEILGIKIERESIAKPVPELKQIR